MAQESIITWNATNWITIVLMVVLGFAIIGMATKIFMSKKASPAA